MLTVTQCLLSAILLGVLYLFFGVSEECVEGQVLHCADRNHRLLL